MPSLLSAACGILGDCTLPIIVHGHFFLQTLYSVAHVNYGWKVAHLTMYDGRDCGNVFSETQGCTLSITVHGQFL